MLIMEVFYLFMVLIVSAHAKVVLDHNEDVHVSNEISKNDPEINRTITASEDKSAAKIAADPNDNEIDSDLGDISTTEEVPEVKVDNGTALILTPFIKDGRIAEARNASRVDSKLFLGFESYSGFLAVNETLKSHLFFWYFPVVEKPVNETPWILWLQGGPGASSMTGLFDEIGPFNYSPHGKQLKKNPYSWLVNHSLLFIDNPVGTGYSYTESEHGFAIDLDTYATHLYTAMKQFMQLFPELQAAPLFVAGESYAGKYVPALAMKIHEQKEWPGGHFNLQGLMLGNALVDPEVISHIASPFQYFGLMDQTQLETIKPLVEGFQADIANNRSVEAKHKWVNLISTLLFFSHQKHAYNFLRDDLNVAKYTAYLATSEVKRALHVGDINFSYLNVTVNMKLAPDFLSNTKPMMEELLEHYRVLVYCGQLDQMLPCLSTSRNYRTWNWNGTQEFLQAVRFPYIFNGRLAGYHKTGGRLTEVVLRGAGHMVPLDAPAPAQAMLAHWTRGEPICHKLPFYEGSFIQSFLRNDTVINI